MKYHSTKLFQLYNRTAIMHKKRHPIMQKVRNILKVRIFMSKMRMPLMHVMKSRRGKKFKLLRHYNYGFLGEYEFTPSSTPLIYCPPYRDVKKKSLRELYSMFFLCKCLGDFNSENGDEEYVLSHAVPAYDIEDFSALEMDEDSVDQRAERFIEWFYEEMRMQGRPSL